MATVTGLTAERMLEIEAASVVDGEVIAGDLILQKFDGTPVNAGSVVGPQGPAGAGFPAGGDAGQLLSKLSGTDYDTEWTDPPEADIGILVGAAVAPGTASDRTPDITIPENGTYVVLYGQRGGSGSISSTAEATCSLYKNGAQVSGSGIGAGTSGSGVVHMSSAISTIAIQVLVAGDTLQCRSAGTAGANTAWIAVFRIS